MTERWRRIEDLFEEALALPPEARSGFISAQSGDDSDLAREVMTLLANATDDGVLRAAVTDAISSFALEGHPIGARLGPYRIVALIGEGGMGAVYRATRDDGEVAYDVAIKILRHELVTAHAIARFRGERQILATLDHPAIVRLLDGGSTDDDVPYLVMELVEGTTITAYLRGRPLRERIALIIQVAGGLAYAHQRLVVHRDIKPSNILVDGNGAPKLLDFGIAKLLVASERDAADTRTGMALLTPQYASPEQARGEPVAVASDVYSLGAVIYEVLAGRPPLTLGANVLETLEAICERDPPRPSAVAPAEDRRGIAGDLDSITLKALQKQPEQRYASIAALVEDLERYLEGLPVRARDATRGYRASKFVARHRGKLALAAIVFGGLATTTAISLQQARRADRQAARAEAEQRRSVRERGWQEVLTGHAGRALPYLVEALRRMPPDEDATALRFLIAEALRPFEAEIAVVPFPGGLSVEAWSPDGRRFALAGQGGLAVHDANGQAALALFDRAVWRIAWSPDGSQIAAAIEGHLRTWDMSGRVVADVPATMPARLAWLPDAALVVAEEHRLAVYDGATARFNVDIAPAGETVTALAVSRDGRRIAIGLMGGRVQLFDTRTGARSGELVGHTSSVVALVMTRDGRLISASHDRTARIWEGSGAPIATITGHNHIIEALALSRDETRVATCSRDGTVKVWDTRTGAFVSELRGHDNGARGADFSPDGRRLVTTGGDNAFRIWDLQTGTLEAQFEARMGGGRSALSGTLDVQWSPTDERILGIAGVGAKLIRATRAPLLAELATQLDKPFESQPRAAAFDPDEHRIAIVGIQQVEIWDARTETRLRDLTSAADHLVWDVAWAHDGRTIAVVGLDLAALVPVDGGPRIPLVGHHGTVNRVAYSPDGSRLVTAGGDGTVRIWDAATGRALAVLTHPGRTSSAAWSHDGARLVTACDDGILRIWDVASGRVTRTIVTGERYLDVSWSPDEQALAAAAHGGSMAVWTIYGSRRFIATGHSGPITTVTWSPDGGLLATSADDQTARIWDARTGKLLAIRRHRNGAMSAAWSRDGARLLTASTDGSVRIWDVHRELRGVAELDSLLARYLQLDRLDGNRELGD